MLSPVQMVERECTASPRLPNDPVRYFAPNALRLSIAFCIVVVFVSEGPEPAEVLGDSRVKADTDREALLSMYTVRGAWNRGTVWPLFAKWRLHLDLTSSPLTNSSKDSSGTGFRRMRCGDADVDPGREIESPGIRDTAVLGLATVEVGISGKGGGENAKRDVVRSFSDPDC